MWIEPQLLRKVTQQALDLPPVLRPPHIIAADQRGTRRRREQRRQNTHQRSFAGAVWTEQAKQAGLDGEVDVVQRQHLPRIGLREMSHLDLHSFSSSSLYLSAIRCGRGARDRRRSAEHT